MVRAVVVNNNFRINEECSVIVLLNSPGDSALQWGVGRGFLSLSTALLCVLMCCFNRHTLVWHGTAKFAFCSFFFCYRYQNSAIVAPIGVKFCVMYTCPGLPYVSSPLWGGAPGDPKSETPPLWRVLCFANAVSIFLFFISANNISN